jgi:hypothetical protein
MVVNIEGNIVDNKIINIECNIIDRKVVKIEDNIVDRKVFNIEYSIISRVKYNEYSLKFILVYYLKLDIYQIIYLPVRLLPYRVKESTIDRIYSRFTGHCWAFATT